MDRRKSQGCKRVISPKIHDFERLEKSLEIKIVSDPKACIEITMEQPKPPDRTVEEDNVVLH